MYQYDTIHNVYYKKSYVLDERNNLREKSLNNFKDKISSSSQDLYSLFEKNKPNKYNYWSLGASNSFPSTASPSSIFLASSPAEYKTEAKSTFLNKLFALLQNIPAGELPYSYGFNSTLEDELLPYKLADGKNNRLNYFVPLGLKVKLAATPLILPSHPYGGFNYALGLKGELEFVKNRSLIFGAEYLDFKFELKDDPRFSNFPLIDPNDPDDSLHELKVHHAFLQFPIILRQKFRGEKKLHPYFQVGLIANKPFDQKYIYEYVDATGEYMLNSTFQQGVFTIDNLNLGVGAEYYFSDKFSIESGIKYQHAFSNRSTGIYPLRYWAMKLDLNYKLF